MSDDDEVFVRIVPGWRFRLGIAAVKIKATSVAVWAFGGCSLEVRDSAGGIVGTTKSLEIGP